MSFNFMAVITICSDLGAQGNKFLFIFCLSLFPLFPHLFVMIDGINRWGANRWKTVETVADFIFLDSKITADGDEAMKLKDAYSLEGKLQQI